MAFYEDFLEGGWLGWPEIRIHYRLIGQKRAPAPGYCLHLRISRLVYIYFDRSFGRKICDLFLIFIVKVLVQYRNFPVKSIQQWQHDLPDLGVGGAIAA